MSTKGPTNQSAEQNDPTASADLKISTQKVNLRATVIVPGPEAKGLLWLTRIVVFMVTGVVSLIVAGVVAVQAPNPGSFGPLAVIGVATTTGVVGVLAGILLSRRLPRRRSKYYTVSAGRPTLHPSVVRPRQLDSDNRPERGQEGGFQTKPRRQRRIQARRRRPRR